MSILSIQSHVAFGYVGNRAAVFALERLGYPVCAIHTVQFSNHTGYGRWTGEAFSAQHIRSVVDGLAQLQVLHNCQAVLSGYLGKPEMGEAILETVALARQYAPGCLYHCDPVMGDVGRGVFVAPEIVPFMRDCVVPTADILTPNHFEFELLVQQPIRSQEQADAVCQNTPHLKEKIIVIKSFRPDDLPIGQLGIYLYTPQGSHCVYTPYIDFNVSPNGTGDLFSAIFLGAYLRNKDPQAGLTQAVDALAIILKHTYQAQTRELQLVQAKWS